VAVQMLLSGQKSLAFQTAMVDVQDNANIGLNYVVSDLKLTNLNMINRDMKSTGISGLVVSNSNYPSLVTANRRISSSGGEDADTQAGKSDVLVIQYRPNMVGGYDCEGTQIETTQEVIVQRYFLRRDDNGAVHDLALACDAGRYSATSTSVSGLHADSTKGGQIIMPRIDHFKVLVGVQDLETQKLSYMTLSQFAALPAAVSADKGKRAVSLQIGLMARSIDNSGTSTPEQTQYSLLNETYSVYKPDTMTTKFIRIPVEQTIALKNGLGER
jgi:type IV pilus assembly protein PilW